MTQLKQPELVNLNNWLSDAMIKVEHIEQRNEAGYFFCQDITHTKNSLTQAILSCRRMDDLLNERYLESQKYSSRMNESCHE